MPSVRRGRRGYGQSSFEAGMWRAGEGRWNRLSIHLEQQQKILFSCLGLSPICFTVDLLI